MNVYVPFRGIHESHWRLLPWVFISCSSIVSATIEFFISDRNLLLNPAVFIEGIPPSMLMNVLSKRHPPTGCTAAFIALIFFSASTDAFLNRRRLWFLLWFFYW